MMLPLATIAGLAALCQAGLLWTRVRAVGRYREPKPCAIPLTVLIAARNEAPRIPALIEALAAQNYPRELWSVLLVDDRSDDGTGEVATRCAREQNLPLTVRRITSVPERWAPKKWALHQGIEAATTEVLLLTDADCLPESRWVASMAAAMAEDADMVAGLAPILSHSSAASRWAAQDGARTALTSVGEALRGRPYMAVGRNWAFRRSVFLEAGGYGDSAFVPSGDDDLLFQRLRAHGARSGLCLAPGSTCPSAAPRTWSDLLRQKRRHASVGSRYPVPVLVTLAFLWMLPMLTLVILGISLFSGQAWARFACACFAFASCGSGVLAADAVYRRAGIPSRHEGLLSASTREAGLILAAPLLALWGLTGFRHWKDG